MGSFEVIKKGFQSTIQDLGRFGYRKIGVPISGVMDLKSMRDANKIVGNTESNPVIEHTFYGGIYRFDDPSIISITGAVCNPDLNGIQIPQYESIKVEKGDKLEINHPTRGCRSYLAIQGSLAIPKVMDSYSTYLTGKFGGLNGRVLDIGDKIEWVSTGKKTSLTEFSKLEIPYFSSKISIEIEEGPEFELLDEASKNELLSNSFQVSSRSNRMGIRLTGEKIEAKKIEMLSSPVIPGMIQLPPSGNPIILMKDGQTIGGYPRIGIVKDSELWRLGQVKSGDKVRFKL